MSAPAHWLAASASALSSGLGSGLDGSELLGRNPGDPSPSLSPSSSLATLAAVLADATLNATAGSPLKSQVLGGAHLGSSTGATASGSNDSGADARLFSAIEAHRLNALRLAHTNLGKSDAAFGSTFAASFTNIYKRSGDAVSPSLRPHSFAASVCCYKLYCSLCRYCPAGWYRFISTPI
jgi:hypothetical protein